MKELTLLHSNDLHGDFLAEQVDAKLVGGAAMLSGYVKQVRATQDNVLYCIAGDMFKGSVIDSEFLGLSTIEIMNVLAPDVVAVGNHEIDYGIAHLLFLEKCARFPIVNANLYIKGSRARLFTPYKILTVGGLRVVFIGIITQQVIAQTRTEGLVGSFVDVGEAAHAVQVILDNYKTTGVDLTVLLTHIGFDSDRQLAAMLDRRWGVDLIIGGHSHTLMTEPCVENGIPIVQAGVGTDQIGRFDIVIDQQNHRMASYRWQCLPIDAAHCPVDAAMEAVIKGYKDQTDAKYGHVMTTFARTLTHPVRNRETELGDLFADLLQRGSSFDVMLYGSGSIRVTQMGPLVTYADFKTSSPYDGPLYMLTVDGAQLRAMLAHMLREEALTGDHTEFYQVSATLRMHWSRRLQAFTSLTVGGRPLTDDRKVTVALQDYHYKNFTDFFGLDVAAVLANGKARVVASSVEAILEEMLPTVNGIDMTSGDRIVIEP